MPVALDREVSFEHEVMPLLLEKAGPHATPPKNSPAPARVRF